MNQCTHTMIEDDDRWDGQTSRDGPNKEPGSPEPPSGSGQWALA